MCVDSGIGKGWAKGLTADTDARIARAAEAHRGKVYRRGPRPEIQMTWSATLAYAAGLIATDGCLIRDGRHIAFVSQDEDLMQAWLSCVGHANRYRRTLSSAGTPLYRVQMSDARLYRWLLAQGLTPRKSLTLGAIAVPSAYFAPFVRGLLDGDGSIYVVRHRPTKSTYPNYWYERLWTFFTSASVTHIEWLQARITDEFGLHGFIEARRRPPRNDFFRLKYGKRESLVLLAKVYADLEVPCLQRKKSKWLGYLERNCAEGGT
jgi:hypothetical protein